MPKRSYPEAVRVERIIVSRLKYTLLDPSPYPNQCLAPGSSGRLLKRRVAIASPRRRMKKPVHDFP